MTGASVRTHNGTEPLGPLPHRWDRVIATAGVHVGRLPYSWVAESAPGAVLLAPMNTDLTGGPLVRFAVHDDGTATGHAHPDLRVGFLELRSHRTTRATAPLPEDPGTHPDVEVSTTGYDPWRMFSDSDHRWPIALAVPSATSFLVSHDDGTRPDALWLREALTGSWARVSPARSGDGYHTVHQYGLRRLWDAAEAAHRWWLARGAPKLHEWEWHVTPTAQTVRMP